ncbi:MULTISPECIES: hypothetical protein [unclassified Kitasatospora]|uniref:hypothetical protein n=1 Tax=unclassified Kitasatospora TaxID=2633591 RepID=UPI0033E97443
MGNAEGHDGSSSSGPPDPFEPLVLLDERGGELVPDESRAFTFAAVRVQIKPWREHLSAEPATALDPATLDALDAAESGL